MPKVASVPLPTEATAGQIARILGVSERVVLGRKADGRRGDDSVRAGGGNSLIVAGGFTPAPRRV